MPLVAYSQLPTFERLRREGRNILEPGRAMHQDIRELHIGLLNMMPDEALAATERQFFRLVGESNQIAQFYMHPFTLPEIERKSEARDYIKTYYEPFEKLQEEGLDALIITGANITDPDLEKAPFWEPLQEVMGWAWENTASTICSCLATHAMMQFRYGRKRSAREDKLWGVYKNRVVERAHPLVAGMNTLFDVPHSRFNDISAAQFKEAGLRVLVSGEYSGVHTAVSEDGFRMVCFQGHPEYDTISLLKEYKREIGRFAGGERPDYPPFPEHYFTPEQQELLGRYRETVKPGREAPPFPEQDFEDKLENTWRDSAKAIIGNWIGLVYQVTNIDRRKAFMDGVDPDDPLALGQTR